MMTKKHFEAIATELFVLRPERRVRTSYGTWVSTVTRLADLFAKENDRFNRATFYTACGYNYVRT